MYKRQAQDNATVKDLISQAGIELKAEDVVNYSLDTPLSEDLYVEVGRVSYETVVETEKIPCSYDEIPLVYSEYSGKYKDVAGTDGEKQITKRLKIVDGEVKETAVVSEKITKHPVSGIKYVDKRSLLDIQNGAPKNYVEKHRIKFTAYTYGCLLYTSRD